MAKAVRWRWGCVSAVALLLIAGGALTAWIYWPGRISHANFQRIQVGMSREQVADLLGSLGEETKSIPSHDVHLPGSPPGWTGVVWGDTFVHWKDGNRLIYIGLAEGRVTSKFYWKYSL